MAAVRSAEWPGWHWLPDRSAWFEGVRSLALAWSPAPALALDAAALGARIAAAAGERAPWLVHPSVGVLLQGSAATEDAQARLAAWVATNTPAPERDALGRLTLARDTWLWMADGPLLAPAGNHALASFTAAASMPDMLAVPDPWGDSLPDTALAGDIGAAAWWARPPLSEAAESELAGDIRTLLALQQQFGDTLPWAADWMRQVARVVVPLMRSDAEQFRSGSIAGVPGLVFVEVTHKALLIMEALIHESAHLHFHLAEFDNDFIAPGHDMLYASPLRRDPRPLRGIFLACHALLYMCAFYKDWERCTGDARAGQARLQLQPQRDAAAQVLRGARSHLSAAGDDFLSRCIECADADDRR
jgi:HEXXH motif-containing protein